MNFGRLNSTRSRLTSTTASYGLTINTSLFRNITKGLCAYTQPRLTLISYKEHTPGRDTSSSFRISDYALYGLVSPRLAFVFAICEFASRLNNLRWTLTA